jgi:hypothetical protein
MATKLQPWLDSIRREPRLRRARPCLPSDDLVRVIATGWVIIACTSAIIWERIAPAKVRARADAARL